MDSIQHRSTPGELFTITAEAVTSTWMLLCAVLLTSAKKPDTYARFLHSHFSASALLVLHLYLETISPYLADGLPTGCQQSRYVSSGIACAVTLLSGTVQQEPDRYRERERLYNQAVAKKLSEIGGEPIEANVIGTGTSIMGRFFSTHMFHIVGGIVVKDQVDLHELPVLSGTMQAEPTTLTALETEKGQVEAPVSRWRFFISIWRPQRSASTVCELFIWQMVEIHAILTPTNSHDLHYCGTRPCISTFLLSKTDTTSARWTRLSVYRLVVRLTIHCGQKNGKFHRSQAPLGHVSVAQTQVSR